MSVRSLQVCIDQVCVSKMSTHLFVTKSLYRVCNQSACNHLSLKARFSPRLAADGSFRCKAICPLSTQATKETPRLYGRKSRRSQPRWLMQDFIPSDGAGESKLAAVGRTADEANDTYQQLISLANRIFGATVLGKRSQTKQCRRAHILLDLMIWRKEQFYEYEIRWKLYVVRRGKCLHIKNLFLFIFYEEIRNAKYLSHCFFVFCQIIVSNVI